MGKRYSIAEARQNLPKIVYAAESGAAIELSRRGRPVAVVVSVREHEQMKASRPRFEEAYAAFLRRFRLREVGLDQGFTDSLRDRGTGRRIGL